MKWTVVWHAQAERELTDAWLDSDDRTAISESSIVVDDILSRRPEEAGESRIGSNRILVVRPLVVAYRVYELDRRVEVLHDWTVRSKQQ